MKMLQINLLPAEFRAAKVDLTWVTDRRVIWPTVALLVTLLGGFLGWLHITDTITNINKDIAVVRSEIDRERPLLEKIKERDAKVAVIAQKNKALKSIQVSKKRWVILFENISSVLPPNMWITNLTDAGSNIMEMKGTTYNFAEIAEYMVSLERQISFTSVVLISINKQQIGGDHAYSFSLKCSINPNLGMEEPGK